MEMMVEIGYQLSSEEHSPSDLVRNAARAEKSGFRFALISDHYHPWIDRQGHSPFVWTVLGAISVATHSLRIGTGVTCPMMRTHPAVIAQAAATTATMLPGRFFLGVGSGENLNEHILGDHWPPAPVRLEMLEEAVAVLRELWQGDYQSYRGKYYIVENARLYDLPDEPIQVYVAASGRVATELAAKIGDGLIGTKPNKEQIEAFEAAVASKKPKYGKVAVCWASGEPEARRTVREWWPNTAFDALGTELALPSHFEEASRSLSEDDVVDAIVCGPDPEQHVERIREYIRAGYDHVCIHQIGPDQEGFFRFYEQEVLPVVRREGLVTAAT